MKRDTRKGGFTLVELLVVISIIALLMAILVPALSRAREQARKMLCLTRMKEVMRAIMAYESSLNCLPANYEESDPYVDRRYYELVAPYVGRKQKVASNDAMDTASDFELFRCPSQDYITRLLQEDTSAGGTVESPRTGELLHGRGTGQGIYGYNPYFSRADSAFRFTSQIIQPSGLPMLADLSAECPDYIYVQRRDGVAGARFNARYPHPSAYNYGWEPAGRGYGNCHSYGPAPNHKCNSINYAFADGHVEAMPNLWPWDDKSDLVSFRDKYFHPRRR